MKSERNRRPQQVVCNKAGDETRGKVVENGSGITGEVWIRLQVALARNQGSFNRRLKLRTLERLGQSKTMMGGAIPWENPHHFIIL